MTRPWPEQTGGAAPSSARGSSAVMHKASLPTINDPPKVMRPGDFVDVAHVIRNWWSFPAVGFNSILEIPVQKLEAFPPENPPPVGTVVVPNSIFGLPIRKDMIYKVYWYHRRKLAGYDATMQLFGWEWPGSNKKVRSQKKSGKGRMSRRRVGHHFPGVFQTALRPRDWGDKVKVNLRIVWKALRCMLSAKFVQDSIKVVDSFNLQSHKTKYLVHHLRRLLGTRCHSALLIHEGNIDVNDNFRWASAHIPSVHRENVEGVSVYNLLKYHQVVITEAALAKLIREIQGFPKKRGWGQRYATPDGTPAPIPEKVPGWNKVWIEKKERLKNAEFRAREFYRSQQGWKWSTELKGPLRIPRHDPLAGFRVKDFITTPEKPVWEKLESLYVDDEPLDEDEEEEFDDLVGAMEDTYRRGEAQRSEMLADGPAEVEGQSLKELAGALPGDAGGGRRSRRSSGGSGGSEGASGEED